MSTTVKNIKIPYPTEGIIRSAQLNDTVAPENSVQLAVNMNFDRVGALQTRPGVETYAPTLTGQIRNFGTLNNGVPAAGYNNLASFGVYDQIGTTFSDYSVNQIDTNHYIFFYQDSGKGYSRVLTVDPLTGNVTFSTPVLTFDIFQGVGNSSVKIDATHYINFWSGSINGNGFAQVFEVNTGTYAVTAIGSPLTFDAATNVVHNKAVLIDGSNHVMNMWTNNTIVQNQVFEVNLSTWAVTAKSTPITILTGAVSYPTTSALNDGRRAIYFWEDPTDSSHGKTQVFEADLTTWAVTAKSTPFAFYTAGYVIYNSCSNIDNQHFINFFMSSPGGQAQTVEVNLSTYAVTNKGTLFTFDARNIYTHGEYNSSLSMGDGLHFYNSWVNETATTPIGKSQIFSVAPITFNVTAFSNQYSNASEFLFGTNVLISPYKVLSISRPVNSSAGITNTNVLFTLGNPVYNNLLYAQQNNGDVYNLAAGVWTSRRTGLQTNHKARFDQFLNYIWMVNGNATIGDPVMTSNGGAFGTDLVPVGFPPVDSIQVGFEGRVWGMDIYADAVYYSNIVQFTPPATYTLTYNPAVNFLKNFTSQDGDKMTALWQAPRALLVFKQNSIYRIYGAASVDAYPAYNVGTFSEESIVQTKDGLYFHHSSGFYKFDYNSQPVEISRRVIDFVKAIPRTSYENIVGVWDGFDAVKWTVGSVTVEGVTYTNCQMRYTISTQIWTIYDYVDNIITAMISFDDGTTLNQIMGTSLGVVGKLDSSNTDFTKPIYYEMIDRWRCFNDMYSYTKAISGLMVSSENGAGAILEYQTEKTPPNVYEYVDTVRDKYDALFPNASTKDFNNLRFRLRGITSGTPMLFHAIEILSLQIKGLDEN